MTASRYIFCIEVYHYQSALFRKRRLWSNYLLITSMHSSLLSFIYALVKLFVSVHDSALSIFFSKKHGHILCSCISRETSDQAGRYMRSKSMAMRKLAKKWSEWGWLWWSELLCCV